MEREQPGEVNKDQPLSCAYRIWTLSCRPSRVPRRFLSDVIRCVLQKVPWVCEEDELSMGPVESERPAGYTGWDGAET